MPENGALWSPRVANARRSAAKRPTAETAETKQIGGDCYPPPLRAHEPLRPFQRSAQETHEDSSVAACTTFGSTATTKIVATLRSRRIRFVTAPLPNLDRRLTHVTKMHNICVMLSTDLLALLGETEFQIQAMAGRYILSRINRASILGVALLMVLVLAAPAFAQGGEAQVRVTHTWRPMHRT